MIIPKLLGEEMQYAQGIGIPVAGAVLGLLGAPRVPPAARARAVPAEPAGAGRSCLRRVRRWGRGPPLDQPLRRPALLRQALTLLAVDQPVGGALDTTRLGGGEVWMAGSVGAGRPWPRGWALRPYPWPTGQCRAPPWQRLPRLQTAVPPAMRWSLVAARGVPRAWLLAQRRHGGTGFRGRRR